MFYCISTISPFKSFIPVLVVTTIIHLTACCYAVRTYDSVYTVGENIENIFTVYVQTFKNAQLLWLEVTLGRSFHLSYHKVSWGIYYLLFLMHQSIPSANFPPLRANPRGIFLRWSKALPRGKIFPQKHGPRGKKTPTPGEYFRRSSQPFLLTGVRNFGILQKSNLEKKWKAVQLVFGHTL